MVRKAGSSADFSQGTQTEGADVRKLELVARKRNDVALYLRQIVCKLILKRDELLKGGLAHNHKLQFTLGRFVLFDFKSLLTFLDRFE